MDHPDLNHYNRHGQPRALCDKYRRMEASALIYARCQYECFQVDIQWNERRESIFLTENQIEPDSNAQKKIPSRST
jgi:hypothetical protein